jgi:hypothetical protein
VYAIGASVKMPNEIGFTVKLSERGIPTKPALALWYPTKAMVEVIAINHLEMVRIFLGSPLHGRLENGI